MATENEPESHEGIERAERIWIGFSLLLVALFVVLVFIAIGAHGTHVGKSEERAAPGDILAQPGFASPGVEQIEPDKYRATVVAQAFSFNPSTIEVPAGAEVEFRLTSRDVIHGFNVADTTINVEVMPGQVSTLTYTFDEPGEYPLICNQYCGTGHHNMVNTVRVTDPDASETTEEAKATAQAESDNGSAGTSDDAGWEARGATVYGNQCVACHQAGGGGVSGAFPPLAGHAPDIIRADGGRDYLINVVLYGLQGPIDVEGQTYNNRMPGFQQLDDEAIAAVINHVVHAWDNEDALPSDFEPVQADEVATQRESTLGAEEVHDKRPDLSAE
ncbi:MAG: c-type cytochrome [Ectothiorhodospiraceae bacterium]